MRVPLTRFTLSEKLQFSNESTNILQDVEAERQRQMGSEPAAVAQPADEPEAASEGGGKVTELVRSTPPCHSPLLAECTLAEFSPPPAQHLLIFERTFRSLPLGD